MVFEIVDIFHLYVGDRCVGCFQFIYRQVCGADEIIALPWECRFLGFIVLHNEARAIFEKTKPVLDGVCCLDGQCVLHF